MFEPADLIVGQQRGKSASLPCLPMAAADFAGRGGALLAQLFGFIQFGGQLAQALLVGHAAFLEQRLAPAAMADRGVGMLDRFDLQRLRPLANSFALGDTLLVLMLYSMVEQSSGRNCSSGCRPSSRAKAALSSARATISLMTRLRHDREFALRGAACRRGGFRCCASSSASRSH